VTFALAWLCFENGRRPDPKQSPLWRISSRKLPHWHAPVTLYTAVDACKRDLKALGIEINVWETLVLERSVMQSSKASPSLNRHLLNSRDKRGRPNVREIDCQLTPYAHCAGGTLISELVFPVTQYKALFENQQSKRKTIVFRD